MRIPAARCAGEICDGDIEGCGERDGECWCRLGVRGIVLVLRVGGCESEGAECEGEGETHGLIRFLFALMEMVVRERNISYVCDCVLDVSIYLFSLQSTSMSNNYFDPRCAAASSNYYTTGS